MLPGSRRITIAAIFRRYTGRSRAVRPLARAESLSSERTRGTAGIRAEGSMGADASTARLSPREGSRLSRHMLLSYRRTIASAERSTEPFHRCCSIRNHGSETDRPNSFASKVGPTLCCFSAVDGRCIYFRSSTLHGWPVVKSRSRVGCGRGELAVGFVDTTKPAGFTCRQKGKRERYRETRHRWNTAMNAQAMADRLDL